MNIGILLSQDIPRYPKISQDGGLRMFRFSGHESHRHEERAAIAEPNSYSGIIDLRHSPMASAHVNADQSYACPTP